MPILTETPEFRSELILANKSDSSVTLNPDYAECQWWAPGSGGAMALQLGPCEQRIIPEAIDFLRTNGVNMGPREEGRSSYHGPLQITVSGAATSNVYAGRALLRSLLPEDNSACSRRASTRARRRPPRPTFTVSTATPGTGPTSPR